MAFSSYRLPTLTDAKETLNNKQLLDVERSTSDHQVGTGEYVFDGENIESWLSLLAQGYHLDFSRSYVKVVPD